MTPVERAYNGDKRHMRPLDPVEELGMPLLEGEQRGTQWPVAICLLGLGLGLFALIGWIVWVTAR